VASEKIRVKVVALATITTLTKRMILREIDRQTQNRRTRTQNQIVDHLRTRPRRLLSSKQTQKCHLHPIV
jgi:hypothetical protein